MSHPFARNINTSILDLKQPRGSFPTASTVLTLWKSAWQFITALTLLEKEYLRHTTHQSALSHRSANSEGQRRCGMLGFIGNRRL